MPTTRVLSADYTVLVRERQGTSVTGFLPKTEKTGAPLTSDFNFRSGIKPSQHRAHRMEQARFALYRKLIPCAYDKAIGQNCGLPSKITVPISRRGLAWISQRKITASHS
jgi:hypothetical protein